MTENKRRMQETFVTFKEDGTRVEIPLCIWQVQNDGSMLFWSPKMKEKHYHFYTNKSTGRKHAVLTTEGKNRSHKQTSLSPKEIYKKFTENR